MKRLSFIAVALLVFALAAVGCNNPGGGAVANTSQTQNLPDDQIIAWVNGEPIPLSVFESMIENMPPQLQMQLMSQEGRKQFAENLVNVELVYQKAKKDGYLNKPEVQQKIDQMARQVVYAEYLNKKLENIPKAGEAEIKAFYESNPQLKDANFDDVKDRIAMVIEQQNQQEAISAEMDKLRVGAEVKFNDDVLSKGAGAPQLPPGLIGEAMKNAVKDQAAKEGSDKPAAPEAPAKPAETK